MALVQKRISSKRLTYLVVLLILFFILCLFFLFKDKIIKPGPSEGGPVNETGDVIQHDLPIYSNLGQDVLQDSRLEELKLHGKFPITPGTLGRSNPFVEAEEE
ncbi:MAG: hypothetical protein PHH01_03380 [Patescibacteria group bacterium]|nr:hypothetical protein [Patescibacteria group bacterium]MDD5567212.1 hypothetical protein [Patescibacteria group bacterium]